MTVPNLVVEIGFDLTSNPVAPFFRLDDDVQGRLDNTEYRLAGTLFYDVTEYVISVDVQRGKSAILSNFPPGECNVQFTNHNRYFDPLFEASPFYPEIVPKRELRVTSGGELIFQGWVEDWDLDYQPNGDSVAVAKAVDTLSVIANQTLDAFTPSVEKAGARINAVLDRPEVNWPAALRDIDEGAVNMSATAVPVDTNALQYLQNVAGSDPGYVFVTADGKFAFRDRRKAPTSANLVELGEGGIPVTNLAVNYGSELLFNRVTVSREGGGTAIASDVASQDSYGIRDLTVESTQLNSDLDLIDFAVGYASLFSRPEYRFDNVGVALEKFDAVDQGKILGLEIGDICSVSFTPNGIAPQIVRYVEVREINHNVQTTFHTVELGFDETRYSPLILDDAVFGKLDVGTLSW
jgi:hypothetical protein